MSASQRLGPRRVPARPRVRSPAPRRSPPCAPSCRRSTTLFTFMRDAELRFSTLRMRIEEHAWTARGEEVLVHDVTLRHPGEVKVLTSRARRRHDRRLRGLGLGRRPPSRPTSRRARSGTRRPVRPTVRGVSGKSDLPGRSRVYVPLTAAPDGDAARAVHPPGGLLPERARRRATAGSTGSTTVAGREAIVLECDHPRTIEMTADRPDFAIRISVDRSDGVILRLEESIGGQVDPRRDRDQLRARRAAAAVGVRVHVPAGHDLHLLATVCRARRRRRALPLRPAAGALPANRTRIAEPAIVITIVARTAVNSSPDDRAGGQADPRQHVAELPHLPEPDRQLDRPRRRAGRSGRGPTPAGPSRRRRARRAARSAAPPRAACPGRSASRPRRRTARRTRRGTAAGGGGPRRSPARSLIARPATNAASAGGTPKNTAPAAGEREARRDRDDQEQVVLGAQPLEDERQHLGRDDGEHAERDEQRERDRQ